jgi:demethylmenaquinone methyltransferase/2-methoxy-6-polyprenyl-1,4-benzoquinol methylase
LGILDFAAPQVWPFAQLYRLYFTRVLPRVGGVISRNSTAYQYLPDSVSKFPDAAALKERILRAGFREASYESWTLGIVALVRAAK